MRSLTVLLLCSGLSFFVSDVAYAAMSDINRIFHQIPQLDALEVCQGGGCLIRLFKPTSISAQQERDRIAIAIGVFEDIVGKKIGTSVDRAGTFNNSSFEGQQDCNDEAINTTTYMRLLKQGGLMPFHEIEDTRTRNFFFTGWPHTTAVISEIKTGQHFAVDSWFYDNGHPATIVPLDVWMKNYQPEDSPVGKSRN
jgi:hypothetical protein